LICWRETHVLQTCFNPNDIFWLLPLFFLLKIEHNKPITRINTRKKTNTDLKQNKYRQRENDAKQVDNENKKDITWFQRLTLIRSSWSRGQATPNKDDISLRKSKIRFEKCDTMKTCPKAPTLSELNRMTPHG
jgi:hypothetical protein